ncbi:hypothetical protein C8A00DRAFT_29709 [Chaetomidium leptoderma]|uniref:BZIP domain-containing protein n=1 Tax=Chaetomidium leptoderma TaxID=669021 RepID=A0AAN6VUA2_9PEZI|nr:hypothetical protein C8A00DRAFT_29709 [Chaetomidium leptoderma]
MSQWPPQEHQQQHVFLSPGSSSSLRYAPSDLPQHNDYNDFDFLNDLAWDPAAANGLGLDLVDPASTTTADVAGLATFSTTPDLEFDYAPPCLDTFVTPLFDLFPSSLQVPPPPLSSATNSLTNTPATTLLESPSPAPPSPDGSDLFPGLKLPSTKPASKPGRRPAGASLSHTADGRITKRSAAPSSTTPATSSADDDDAEAVSRRYRNNIAAKRYRQKKIDRIEELEDVVKNVTQERDDLRIRLARQEAEVAALREMLKMKLGGEGSKD